ncbi:MAG: MBL fold metallo-hydrolase [Candidatus Hydrogenedentes bacterium]|nr:MBL fold metallo-hydrolase [Candidatus Hydrogenedentota bacterium]
MSRITVLCENTAAGKHLTGEHGLSFWIEHNNHSILFDTGQGYCLKHNADILGISLPSADAIVLSHGHFDHTGGLPDALAETNMPSVFLHPQALSPRYACREDGSYEIGMAQPIEELLRKRAKLIFTEGPTELCPGIFVTGTIPRQTDFEDSGGPFFWDEDGSELDTFPDDQALYFETSAGTVVVLGCAHAGIVNTLMYVQKLTDNNPIYAVLGGTHLVAANEERMNKTLDFLRTLQIQRLQPAHCTGFIAMARLWHAFPDQYAPCPVGSIINIPE